MSNLNSLLVADLSLVLAYVGPGAGLELVGYSMSLLAWMTVAFSALLLYPFYSFLRFIRGCRAAQVNPDTAVSEEQRDVAQVNA